LGNPGHEKSEQPRKKVKNPCRRFMGGQQWWNWIARDQLWGVGGGRIGEKKDGEEGVKKTWGAEPRTNATMLWFHKRLGKTNNSCWGAKQEMQAGKKGGARKRATHLQKKRSDRSTNIAQHTNTPKTAPHLDDTGKETESLLYTKRGGVGDTGGRVTEGI